MFRKEGNMKEIVGIYCRLSEEDRNKQDKDADSESIQNQKSMLIQYALEKGWEIYDIYSDEDYSGADRKRPRFNQLIKDAEDRKITIVLCKTQSRFSREVEIIERYIHGCFLEWGVRFIGVLDNADTAVRGNKKSRQINGLVNEWYLEDLSENIKGTLRNKMREGKHIGSSVVYGYKKDPEHKGNIIIDPPAAAIVREVFEMFASGISKNDITRILNERGVPNPSSYKRMTGQYNRRSAGKMGDLWGYNYIRLMLMQEAYLGTLTQGKTGTVSYKIKKKRNKPKEEWIRIENNHPPIIDRELWDKVQEIIKERATPCYKDRKMNIFARRIRCAHCGYTMHIYTSNLDKKYFRCATKTSKRINACIGSFIPYEVLYQYVFEQYKAYIDKYLQPQKAEDMIYLQKNENEKKEELQSQILLYEKKIADIQKIIKELYADKVLGNINMEEFQTLSVDFHDEEENYKKIVADAKRKISEMEEMRERYLTKREVLEKYRMLNELTYDIIHIFIDHIEVSHRNNVKESYSIKIFWNF